MAAKQRVPLDEILKTVKGHVHVHKTPKCTSKKHDPSCGQKGGEIKCVPVRVPGHDNNLCICVHA